MLFNSRPHLSRLLLRSYYDSKRSIGEVLFLINFIGVIFEAGNETRVILALNKSEERSQKSGFCSYRCFRETEKLMCEEIFSKRAKFFVHVRHFKAVFFHFLVKRFRYDFRLVLGWCN